ncbi:MAG TPA: hypothetical protein VGD07_15325 [Methylomirabilota bacterium]
MTGDQGLILGGSGHPAVVTVACVLVPSQGLQNSGVVDATPTTAAGNPRCTPTDIAAARRPGASCPSVLFDFEQDPSCSVANRL